MGKCEWCQTETDKLHSVMSLGIAYKICNKCYQANEDEVCIKCGEPIMGSSIKGKCYGCAQEEYEEKQRKEEEYANGVASELLERYTSEIEFTEADYEQWLTFGQGNFTPEYRKRCRQNWLRTKLIDQGGWEPAVVEANLEDLETLMDRYMSKVIDKKYKIVYYDGKNKNQPRIRQFIDHKGKIFIVEKKK